jgi:transcriptional regulator with XRE-family HTH domain
MARYRVKELAEAQGLDAAKLARRADLAYGTVAGLWNDKTQRPDYDSLEAIARELGVAVRDLFSEGEVSPKRSPLPVGVSY